MTKTQLIHNLDTLCEQADRWDAIRAAAYQPRPVPARPRVWQWAAVAVVALVVAVLGVNQILHAPETAPPLLPEEPTAVVGATTDTTTTETTGTSTTPSTAESTAPTTTAPTISTTKNQTTTGRPTGPDTTVTGTVPTSGPEQTTGPITEPSATSTHPTDTPPITVGTAPDSLPILNSDGKVAASRDGGGLSSAGYLFAYNFEEMGIQSITKAPSILPVYAVPKDKTYSQEELADILTRYATLAGDTLTAPPTYSVRNCINGEGERFTYNLNLAECNYIMLWLRQPVALGETSTWMQTAMAHTPSLFADMEKPTLRISAGRREWDRVWGEPAKTHKTVTFDAQVYDAANDPDGTARWLNGVTLKVEDGMLKGFFILFDDAYQKLGDYPLITIEEAKDWARAYCDDILYLNENYEFLSVELLYLPHGASHLRVPLYRFLVPADQTAYEHELRAETGLTPFFQILVPAVPAAYWTPGSYDVHIK